MRFLAIFLLFPLVSACGSEEQQEEFGKKVNAAITTNESPKYIGRFAYYPPAGEMPAVLLDTATGCVEFFEKAISVDNPDDVDWWRKYADTTMPQLNYVDGKPEAVADSAPPRRCPDYKEKSK